MGTQDPTSSPASNMAVGFEANAETCASKSSRGAALGTPGYADGYLMMFLWHQTQVRAL